MSLKGRFNTELRKRLYRLLNETPLFKLTEELHSKFDFACVLQDRIADSVAYLEMVKIPSDESQFYLLMVHSCIVVNAVRQAHKIFSVSYKYDSDDCEIKSRFFSVEAKKLLADLNSDKAIPSDDRFFEYFRALSFTHPFETNRYSFIPKNVIHYSPYVLPHRHAMPAGKIGINAYVTGLDDALHIYIPFERLINYVISRYDALEDVLIAMENIVLEQEKIWASHKLEVKDSPETTLRAMANMLEARHQGNHHVCELIGYMTLDVSALDDMTRKSVDVFMKSVEESIPRLVYHFNALDYEALHNEVEEFISAHLPYDPPYNHLGYYREKIYCHLTKQDQVENESDYDWARRQAASFAEEEYAKRWVTIDVDSQSDDVIKMLVAVACFCEKLRLVSIGRMKPGERPETPYGFKLIDITNIKS